MSALYAATHPDRVTHLVLCGTFACYVGEGDGSHGRPGDLPALRGVGRRAVGRGRLRAHPHAVADRHRAPRRCSPASSARPRVPGTIRALWEAVGADRRPPGAADHPGADAGDAPAPTRPCPSTPRRYLADDDPRRPPTSTLPGVRPRAVGRRHRDLRGDHRGVRHRPRVGGRARRPGAGHRAVHRRGRVDDPRRVAGRPALARPARPVPGRACAASSSATGARRSTRAATTSSSPSTGRRAPSAAPTPSPTARGQDRPRGALRRAHRRGRGAGRRHRRAWPCTSAPACPRWRDAGEILATTTVRDLVVGSEICFDERGEHELKGVPGRWRLVAVGDAA